MAFRAIQSSVFTIQGEAGNGMIEAGATPPLGCVTGAAVRAELPVMVIILGVASITIRRRTFVSIGMAGLARCTRMFTDQREAGHGMVEGRACPTLGGMTCTTIGAKLSVVVVILGMTGKTVRGRAFIAVGMADFALDIAMLPGQREAGVGMIERYF